MTIDEFLDKLENVQKHGKYYTAKCPAHDDKRSSLTIQAGDKPGVILIKCHAGCEKPAILAAIGTDWQAVMPPKEKQPAQRKALPTEFVKERVTFPGSWKDGDTRDEITDAYIYRNPKGEPVYAVLRTKNKTAFPQGKIQDGKWTAGLSGVPKIIYNLPEVLQAAENGETIYVCEGEKDCDAIMLKGRVATCNSGGAGKWEYDFAHYLKKAGMVVVVRDKDQAGLEHARKVGRSCKQLNIPYRLVEAAEGKDAYDHIAAGYGLEEFVDVEEDPYLSLGGKLFRRTADKDGKPKFECLANFDARIIREVIVDDGQTTEMVFQVTGAVDGNGGPKRFEIPSKDFQSLNWIVPKLGAKAIVQPGMSKKDHLRTAIQFLSDPEHGFVYAQAGWRSIDGRPMFLTNSGGIGEEGLNKEVDVDLGRMGLGNLSVEAHDDPWPCLDKLHQSLAADVWCPVVGSVFLAPLMPFCDPDYALLIVGESGKFKSEIAAIAQSFYGRYKRTNLVGNLDSTENFIERVLHAGKDCAIVVDDFYPSNDRGKAMRLAGVLDRVLRATGNRQSRGRMMADTTIRQGYTPKCLPIVTAERLPIGQSNNARAYTVELEGAIIRPDELTELQHMAAQGMFAGVMFEYLKWVAKNWERLRDTVPEKYESIRGRLSTDGHRRAASNSAWITLGVWAYCEFLHAVGRMSHETRENIAIATLGAVKKVAVSSAERVHEQSLHAVFLSMVREGLATGRCHLKGTVSDRPENPEQWGWASRNGTLEGQGQMIGYLSGDYIFLVPSAAYTFACTQARAQDLNFGIDQPSLYRRLADRGIVVSHQNQTGTSVVVRTHHGIMRVCKIPVAKMLEPDTAGDASAEMPAEIPEQA